MPSGYHPPETKMQLYYHPYACSLAVLIAASEAGIPLDLVKVDIAETPHSLPDGSDFAEVVTGKNYVPVLTLDDGSQMSEVAVILQYLADLEVGSGLAPGAATFERYKLQEWLNFIASELHKFYSPWLFHPETGEVAQAFARDKITGRLAMIDSQLAAREFLLPGGYSVADAYLYTMVNWSKVTGISLVPHGNLTNWFGRVGARPAVKAALRRHV